MAGNILDIGDSDFKAQVLDSAEPVLLDFWASWCAPCRAITPALEDLAVQYKGKAKIVKMNVDEHRTTPEQFGVRSIPMLLLFKNGKVVEQILGAVPKTRIEEAIKKTLS